jgi:hypothetical protein
LGLVGRLVLVGRAAVATGLVEGRNKLAEGWFT